MYNVHNVQILVLLELQGGKRSWKSGGYQTFHRICRPQPSYHVGFINLKAIFNILMEWLPGTPTTSVMSPSSKVYFNLIHYKCLASTWEMGIKSSPDGIYKIQKCQDPCEENSPRATASCLSLALLRHKWQTLLRTTNGGNKKYHRMDILKAS